MNSLTPRLELGEVIREIVWAGSFRQFDMDARSATPEAIEKALEAARSLPGSDAQERCRLTSHSDGGCGVMTRQAPEAGTVGATP